MYPGLKTIKQKAGAPFFLSVSSSVLKSSELKMLKEINPAGIIYFKRNIENCESLQYLIKSTCSVDSIKYHAVDEEGGRVRRLPAGEWSLPSMLEIAENGNLFATEKIDVLGRKLQSIGINMNMAPNVDLRSGENTSIVGDRSFGEDPQQVIQFAEIYIEMMKKNGIYPVLKHFPGHGTTTVDSHKSLPVINKPLDALFEEDLLPYKALANKAGFVMVAHLLHPDVSDLPATLSRKWNEILRKNTGFKGISMTDDMEMHALDSYSYLEKMELFYESGIDMLLVCSGNEEAISGFFEASVRMVEKGVSGKFKH
ncbi:MAG TPA: beta-N-acetylhexosaminidase [bacterium]|nr:beta-N-acetylhexosaminidase [bacterium]